MWPPIPALLFQTLLFVHIVLLGQLVLAAKLQENHVSVSLCKSCPRLNRIASVYEMWRWTHPGGTLTPKQCEETKKNTYWGWQAFMFYRTSHMHTLKQHIHILPFSLSDLLVKYFLCGCLSKEIHLDFCALASFILTSIYSTVARYSLAQKLFMEK